MYKISGKCFVRRSRYFLPVFIDFGIGKMAIHKVGKVYMDMAGIVYADFSEWLPFIQRLDDGSCRLYFCRKKWRTVFGVVLERVLVCGECCTNTLLLNQLSKTVS